jgi:hypothetical protein
MGAVLFLKQLNIQGRWSFWTLSNLKNYNIILLDRFLKIIRMNENTLTH